MNIEVQVSMNVEIVLMFFANAKADLRRYLSNEKCHHDSKIFKHTSVIIIRSTLNEWFIYQLTFYHLIKRDNRRYKDFSMGYIYL